ncbi:hypothetical protein KNP414_03177 [Paenibacillus mucilaginosus KNP414]|uniref:Uncharacterized protein n=1 Tax=Paenibacillus mucilaginosus (strain KNP414) TaxID=1036673 RepID=F8FD75_PAEMK|nr:hypothetical protein KNP414_03177 [Paenibacillus mucilaginosus KNP414]
MILILSQYSPADKKRTVISKRISSEFVWKLWVHLLIHPHSSSSLLMGWNPGLPL